MIFSYCILVACIPYVLLIHDNKRTVFGLRARDVPPAIFLTMILFESIVLYLLVLTVRAMAAFFKG